MPFLLPPFRVQNETNAPAPGAARLTVALGTISHPFGVITIGGLPIDEPIDLVFRGAYALRQSDKHQFVAARE
jgi:hypothetical protein